MTDKMLQLAVYGWMVRTVVEFIQAALKISGKDSPRLVQAIAAVVSAGFVFVLNVNVGVFMSEMGEAARWAQVAILAGTAMSVNDLLDMLPRLGKR